MGDVAALCGESSRDVALVLAGVPMVEPDVRRRVVDAIDQTGYRPLEAIQARLGRPLRLAIVFRSYRSDDPEANRFYTPVASAISIACVQQGASVRQATMNVSAQYELGRIPSELTDGSYDAAFILGSQLDAAAVEQIIEKACPVVLVDGYSEGNALDSVVADNVAGGKAAVEHLVAAGHREIALLGTEPVCYPSIQDRRTGYAQAIEGHGLRAHFIDASYIHTEAVAVLGVDYIQRHPAVTALFGAIDLITVSFMQLARDAGLRLPADLSLVGFDDIDLASLVMPGLTTLAIDRPIMSRAAFALLVHRLEVPTAAPITAVTVPRLVERESVAVPRAR